MRDCLRYRMICRINRKDRWNCGRWSRRCVGNVSFRAGWTWLCLIFCILVWDRMSFILWWRCPMVSGHVVQENSLISWLPYQFVSFVQVAIYWQRVTYWLLSRRRRRQLRCHFGIWRLGWVRFCWIRCCTSRGSLSICTLRLWRDGTSGNACRSGF